MHSLKRNFKFSRLPQLQSWRAYARRRLSAAAANSSLLGRLADWQRTTMASTGMLFFFALLAAGAALSTGFAPQDGTGADREERERSFLPAISEALYCGINDNLKLSIEDCTTSACRHKQSPMMNVTFEGYPTCVEAYSIASDGEVEISVGAPKDCLTQVLGRIFGSAKAWNSLDISALRGPHGYLFRCVM